MRTVRIDRGFAVRMAPFWRVFTNAREEQEETAGDKEHMMTNAPVKGRILGIDPGSRFTGYGIIDHAGQKSVHVAHGAIATKGDDFPQRLGQIFTQLAEIVRTYQPEQVAIEDVFMARNAASDLKLGQARGAAIAAVVQFDLPVAEYAARQVKQALTGRGSADKAQVAQMVRYLLALTTTPKGDAADALGIAICHAHMGTSLARIKGATARRGTRVL